MEKEIQEENNQSLSCDLLSKVYGKKGTRALDSISFSIPTRGVFALIGRNGSGKTSLVRILATELEPTSGRAFINGIDVVKEPRKLRERIAIVPQEARTVMWMSPKQTALSYLLWRGHEYGDAKRRATETLERLSMGKFADTLNRKLSGGMKRRALVAAILASDAEIIFMDEPTTGLDPISRRELWDFLIETGKQRFTFLTTHYLEEAEHLGNQIGILDRGKLLQIGTMQSLRKKMKYDYSLILFPDTPLSALPKLGRGEIIPGKDGSTRILTDEEEAFCVARELSKIGSRFTINPVTLDDIFEYLVDRPNDEEVGKIASELSVPDQKDKQG